MTKQPLVSIVTPSYNQGSFIERTILSVLKQNYPRIEYIVLDSMSTDATGDILKKYSKQINIIVREKDNGQSDAINKGFQLASGEIIAYLNSDDCYASPDVVQDAVMNLEQSRADLVYGRRYYVDENGHYLLSWPFRKHDDRRLLKSCYLPQECSFWSREIYDRAGGFIDTSYEFALDYELWCRFLKYGARFKAINKVYGLFRQHSQAKSTAAFMNVGVPEIARIQAKYTATTNSLAELQNQFIMHYLKVAPNSPSDFNVANLAMHAQFKQFKSYFASAPLDYWVYAESTLETLAY